jgi:Fe-S cluster assembly protein SufD
MAVQAAQDNLYAKQFEALMASHPDGPVKELRRRAFARFLELGFPTSRNEDWKYTNIASIAKQEWKIDTLSTRSELPRSSGELAWGFDAQRNGFAALNLAFGDFQVLTIPRETVLDKPIELNFSAAEQSAIFPHVLIFAEAGSKATIVETYESRHASFTNAALQIVVEPNANLTHYRVQRDSPEAFHVGTTEVAIDAGARYNSTNINLGAALSRHDIDVKFIAEGGEAWVDGLYMLGGSQHHDTHSLIDHLVPNCTSHQTYRGVLNDRSRGVFNGKVVVRENAHGTDAQQSNKNLLLSNEARVDTKPQLEIFNEDVKCSHGATVGQLEDEELFYLRARGLPDGLARNLLTYGFAEAVIEKIGIESIRNDLDAAVLNRLSVELKV